MQVQSGINQVRHKFIIYANLQGHPSRSPVKVKVSSSKFDLDLAGFAPSLTPTEVNGAKRV